MTEELSRRMLSFFEDSSDFYSVEYENGKMVVYPLGYFYCAGNSITDNPEEIYRFEEYSQVPFTLKELWECNYTPDENEAFQCRSGDAMYDLTWETACAKLIELMVEMGSSKHCVPYDMLQEGTPAGIYYNGDALIWED